MAYNVRFAVDQKVVMKIRNGALVVLVCMAVAGCSDKKSNLQREQQQYNVVQEGQASGVTGTLQVPGEVAPTQTAYGMTATNADTTSAFTLSGGAVTTDTTSTAGSLGATLPASGGGGNFGSYTPPPRPRPVTPRQAETPVETNPPQPSSPAPAPAPTPQPATDTSNPAPAPPTTTTQTPPPSDENKSDQKQPDQPEPQPQPPPPPPPTTTDTRGNDAGEGTRAPL